MSVKESVRIALRKPLASGGRVCGADSRKSILQRTVGAQNPNAGEGTTDDRVHTGYYCGK